MPLTLTTVALEARQLAALRKRAGRRVAAGESGASVSAVLREILREHLEMKVPRGAEGDGQPPESR